MPLYFYHLTFELYPYPRPLLERESTASNPKNTEAEPGEAQAWTPQPGSSIFETRDWPRHQRIGHLGETGEANIQLDRKEYEYLTGGRKQEGLKSSAAVGRGDGGLIDCGAAKGSPPSKAHDTTVTTRPPTAAASHSPAASPANPFEARDQRIAVQDYRFGQVRVESVDIIDMGERGERPSGRRRGESSISMGGTDGISAGLAGGESAVRVTKGRFEQLEGKNTEAGWGIVHLYRDGEETTGLNGSVLDTTHAQSHNAVAGGAAECVDGEKGKEGEPPEEDCTTLCIPAVPTYLTYNDFLGFAGKKAIEEISHFRMVMTGRSNRYMVLMKFRDPKAARRWKAEYDGKLFIEMEPETCHVLFVKSITLQTPTTSFPSPSPHDPFTPSSNPTYLKPFPPPTHSLVELPTCPVCLERMDDTTGLLTILCQHLFHCACLQKWQGRGCPVCRYPNSPFPLSLSSALPSSQLASLSSAGYDPNNPPFGSGDASLCSICDTTEDLWICLICGKVGCGRYKGGHAKEHWKQSAHNFALEIETQHVWDYAEDAWVHRLIREKGDSKLIELPSSRSSGFGRSNGGGGHGHGNAEDDMVPREKLERIGLEYTHLLTSQLESQRVYFEELVGKAVAKASSASSAAATASQRADEALSQLKDLQLAYRHLKDEVIVGLEKDLAREKKRADKSAELARGFGRSLTEEKEVNAGLMKRIEHVNTSMAAMSKEVGVLKEENADLKEQNRDLLFSITASSKIQDLQEGGGLEEGELEGGTVSLPPEKKGRGRGKGKK